MASKTPAAVLDGFILYYCTIAGVCYTIRYMTPLEKTPELEEEIRELEEKLEAKKHALEEVEKKEEKEVFGEVLKEHVEAVQKKIASLPPSQQTAATQHRADTLNEEEHSEQVAALVEIALTRGILHAVQVAQRLKNPHILDDFHDALVDRYYEKLVLSRVITKGE